MKMIRDHIPGLSWKRQAAASLALERILFHEKLLEEFDEFMDARGDDAADELADLLEVVHSLAHRHAFDMDDIENRRRAKAATHGCFHRLTILEDS
jgi:predicted house-cleaning noncanonical NTP pyrophosphatase (MazG superfamily)